MILSESPTPHRCTYHYCPIEHHASTITRPLASRLPSPYIKLHPIKPSKQKWDLGGILPGQTKLYDVSKVTMVDGRDHLIPSISGILPQQRYQSGQYIPSITI